VEKAESLSIVDVPVVDATFEQFAGQSDVRRVSVPWTHYTVLRVTGSLGLETARGYWWGLRFVAIAQHLTSASPSRCCRLVNCAAVGCLPAVAGI
jgi:hypothetical protein